MSILPHDATLFIAVPLSLALLLFAFVQTWIYCFGLQTLPRIATALNHPHVLGELIAESAGASLFFPVGHVAITSLFKSKRNPSSRRRIFIGWSVLIIAVGVVFLWTKSRGI